MRIYRYFDRKNLYERITMYLHTIGIPLRVLGFLYLREAIKMCVEDASLRMGSIGKKVYTVIAQAMGTTVSKVERNIRHAIETGWDNDKIKRLNELVGAEVFAKYEKPTNCMLIALLADKIFLDGMRTAPD